MTDDDVTGCWKTNDPAPRHNSVDHRMVDLERGRSGLVFNPRAHRGSIGLWAFIYSRGGQSLDSTRAPDAALESQRRGVSANRASYSRASTGPASRSASSSPTTIAHPPHPAPVSRA